MTLDPKIRSSMVLPVVCAPMMMVSGPALVRESCRNGVMAGLPRHNARDRVEFEAWLRRLRTELNAHVEAHPGAVVGPLAVNLIARGDLTELRADLDVCAKYRVEIVLTALGNPSELTKVVHDWGGRVFHDVTTLKHAEKAIAGGVDGLTCIGSGGGGHSGTVNALAFIPRVRALFDGTIIFAGSVSTGAAVRAAEVLGADLAYLGTRFIATQESAAPDAYKAFLVAAGVEDLVYSDRLTGVPANWLKDSLRRVGLDPAAIPVAATNRAMGGRYSHLPADVRPWRDVWSAGQGVELIHDVPTVAALVRRLREEYARACRVPVWAGAGDAA